MLSCGSKYALLVSGAVFGLYAHSGFAQSMTAQAIKEARVIDVPLVMGEIDPSQRSESLWTKGDKPANSLLARFSVRPVQVAVIGGVGAEQAGHVLWRAFPGGGITALRSNELNLSDGPRYFCGEDDGRSGRPSCFIDQDGNGSFDQMADAFRERGSKPYHITIINVAKQLNEPLPYRIMADEQRPVITVEMHNCGKDYDRPRFSATSTNDRNILPRSTGLVWHDKDSSFAGCRRGDRLDSLYTATVTVPTGGYLAQIGPLAFTVGPKSNPNLGLVGPTNPLALYRLEGATLVNLSIGRTPGQAELIAAKSFPNPMMMTDAGAIIHDGPLASQGKLATVPFRHAYRGKLTQDVSISTLFGKRSLAAGTIVYGFPGRARLTWSRGGVPELQSVGDAEYRNIKLELTWCAPVHAATTGKEEPNPIGRGGWSAACIPHGTFGNHTIITNLQPAFGVSSLSYNVATSSNDGPPPIERADESAFEQPLRVEYVYEGVDGEFISLSEQIYFGGELTSSSPEKIYAPSGKALVEIAGVRVELTRTGADLLVKPAGTPVVSSNPRLRWDRRPLMVQQLKKMGLKLADPDAAANDDASLSAGSD